MAVDSPNHDFNGFSETSYVDLIFIYSQASHKEIRLNFNVFPACTVLQILDLVSASSYVMFSIILYAKERGWEKVDIFW